MKNDQIFITFSSRFLKPMGETQIREKWWNCNKITKQLRLEEVSGEHLVQPPAQSRVSCSRLFRKTKQQFWAQGQQVFMTSPLSCCLTSGYSLITFYLRGPICDRKMLNSSTIPKLSHDFQKNCFPTVVGNSKNILKATLRLPKALASTLQHCCNSYLHRVCQYKVIHPSPLEEG